jgi:hypothetical protein
MQMDLDCNGVEPKRETAGDANPACSMKSVTREKMRMDVERGGVEPKRETGDTPIRPACSMKSVQDLGIWGMRTQILDNPGYSINSLPLTCLPVDLAL